MKKIAYVINSMKQTGPSSVVINLIKNLDPQKYEITLITLFLENDEKIISSLKELGVRVIECSYQSRLQLLLRGKKSFQKLIQTNGFDIVHTHGFIPDIMMGKTSLKVKKVTTIHSNLCEDYANEYGILSKIYLRIHLHYLKKLDHCVCCSKSVYDVLQKYLKHGTYIRNGINSTLVLPQFDKESLGIPSSSFLFVYAGRLTAGKNIVSLIQEFGKYHQQDEYLLVLGDGEEFQQCVEIADTHVKMLGFQTNFLPYFAISDVYISASKSEGFSISVLEALGQGLGLFLSDIPSHREIFQMEHDFYLGEIFSLSSFAAQLEELRKRKGEIQRKQISNWKEDNLSAHVMAQKYMEIYEGNDF